MGSDQGQRLEAAFRENRTILRKWLIGRLGDVTDADDVLQSVYLRIWTYAETNEIEHPRALIFKTATNLATNELVSRRRRYLRTSNAEADEVEAVRAVGPTPEEQSLLREDIQRALAEIGNLKPKVRRAFELSRLEGKTYAEIAGLLGVSESSVEKYIIEALRILRARLRPGEGAKILPFSAAGARV
ncbi:RNA polymerase sigma factor [Pacificimonas sp. WHA3]|uniref:RNA polymerase sigma factor n=1 Tax=Pacificimonas pallii TaxID=2827236 RepID=A0ABS6SB91_9SPHN|nr:RNA polymerase sigma factor [Pacificimonas pallii]MBV7255625.1 RNA polymerase sigma factor [Pacificimonas pallii]